MGLSPFQTNPELGQRFSAITGAGSRLRAFGQTPSTQIADAYSSARSGLQPLAAAPARAANRFTDPNYGTGQIGNIYTQQGAFADAGQTAQQFGQTGGMATQVGGNWAALDQHNAEINSAASQVGVPANLLKAMINRESSGNWGRDNRIHYGFRNKRMLPFVGIFEDAAQSHGLNFDAMVGNKGAQIAGMATILKNLASQYGGFENAAKVYFGGEAALGGGFTDELGMDSETYGNTAVRDWKWLDQQAGYSGGYGDGGVGTGIAQKALEFVGVPYVWGSLPQAGDDPWQRGWDCSGFIDYLDNTYGSNELPAGSHYQWQDTVDKGLVISDPNQLRSGDLVFFDTGGRAGGGAGLNAASHVGMYIGNGQFIQAANPGAGTIVSNLADYIQMYGFLGGRKMGWSGGSATQQTNTPKFSSLIQKYLLAA
jgi:cell wall-associated NlpC family hydrolase